VGKTFFVRFIISANSEGVLNPDNELKKILERSKTTLKTSGEDVNQAFNGLNFQKDYLTSEEIKPTKFQKRENKNRPSKRAKTTLETSEEDSFRSIALKNLKPKSDEKSDNLFFEEDAELYELLKNNLRNKLKNYTQNECKRSDEGAEKMIENLNRISSENSKDDLEKTKGKNTL
jgi:hypothetical protein